MTSQDPVSVVRSFNDCINNRDTEGLSGLMTENHTFIDRDGKSHGPKSYMVDGWIRFFNTFPKYRNTFKKIESAGNHVFVLGFAYWSEEEPYDPVIWTAVIENNLVAEWRVYEDTAGNRKKFNLY
ncbi:MAG: nuclear transport factor 2 family protein [Bacteroidales bacterium]|nr:MAG: nuclear transport factor 2 family protein [Bacteroidales bacterium]